MDQTNQTNGRVDKKPVLFSISSYSVSIVIIFFSYHFWLLIDAYNKSKSDLSRLFLKKVIVIILNQLLLSPFQERNTRVINKIPKTNPFHTASTVSPPPPLRDPSRGINSRNRPMSLNSAESVNNDARSNSIRPSSFHVAQNGTTDRYQSSPERESCSLGSNIEKPDRPPSMIER